MSQDQDFARGRHVHDVAGSKVRVASTSESESDGAVQPSHRRLQAEKQHHTAWRTVNIL